MTKSNSGRKRFIPSDSFAAHHEGKSGQNTNSNLEVETQAEAIGGMPVAFSSRLIQPAFLYNPGHCRLKTFSLLWLIG